jgi:hypothetical protein
MIAFSFDCFGDQNRGLKIIGEGEGSVNGQHVCAATLVNFDIVHRSLLVSL